jgi:hypothetical protein
VRRLVEGSLTGVLEGGGECFTTTVSLARLSLSIGLGQPKPTSLSRVGPQCLQFKM